MEELPTNTTPPAAGGCAASAAVPATDAADLDSSSVGLNQIALGLTVLTATGIVAELTRKGHLVVADTFAVTEAKTQSLIAKLQQDACGTDILLVMDAVDKNLFLSARNLHKVGVCDVEALNPVALLRHEKVLMTREAVKKLEAWLA